MVMVATGTVVMRVTRLMLVAVIVIVAMLMIVVMSMSIDVLVLMFRLRFHLFVIRSEVGLRLGNVLEQFGQHAADVVIGGKIENLLAFTLGAYDPRRPQQTQVMADERSRQSQRFRDCSHRAAPLDARQHDSQARGIAQQAKQVSERNNALIGCYKGSRQNKSANN
ncbi:hypothetical protein SBC2_27050 [Caballeronia sp. SBC2]|nr:hypothetical protein SBC2_27050 [Caballeronia sp. SBC2]